MSSKSWLAIDGGTAPMLRARELRFAWELFVASLGHSEGDQDGDPDDVREPIVESWRRSFAAGVDPTGHELAPVVADEDETQMLWEEHPLGRTSALIHQCLAAIAEEADHLIVVTDSNGVLLSVEGSAHLRLRAADHMNFTGGALWSEPGAGTNAIGTALAVDHAVQVFGPEHFNEAVQRWTCSAAPIHDPETGRLLGVIDLTGDFSTVHPHSLAVVTATALAVETSLRLDMQEHDLRLRARYGHQVAVAPDSRALVTPIGRPITEVPASWGANGRLAIPPGGGRLRLSSGEVAIAESVGPSEEAFLVRVDTGPTRSAARPLAHLRLLGRQRALLDVDGRITEVRPRLGEILALLCAHPEGLSADALCADLHGDRGRTASVRVEVSRLRKLLGPWIDTDRYRLTCDVETDVRRVEGLLRTGAAREAAEEYPGPLLPGSEAPAIVDAREQLDAWVRQAVMTSGDPDALWAWVNSPSGRDDLGAWLRLLSHLDFRDPRRSLCASRVGELRRSSALPAAPRPV
jgi:GAF domain-containing protein